MGLYAPIADPIMICPGNGGRDGCIVCGGGVGCKRSAMAIKQQWMVHDSVVEPMLQAK